LPQPSYLGVGSRIDRVGATDRPVAGTDESFPVSHVYCVAAHRDYSGDLLVLALSL
jgi:hypothetical protein